MIRSSKSWQAVAVAAVAGLALSACGTTEDGDDDGGGGGGGSEAACDLKLAFFGPQTGPAAGLGKPIIQRRPAGRRPVQRGRRLRGRAGRPTTRRAAPTQAPALATEVAGDESIIGVVGPAFSGESAAAGPIFAEAGLPTITPSATNPTLAENGWDTFHRALGNDATQGPAAAAYIKDTLEGQEHLRHRRRLRVRRRPGRHRRGGPRRQRRRRHRHDPGRCRPTSPRPSPRSSTPTPTRCSSVATTPRRRMLIGQLRDGGFDGTFVVADGVKDPAFLDAR